MKKNKLMFSINRLRNGVNPRRRWRYRALGILTALLPLTLAWADDSDPLSGMRGMIQSMFGGHSTVMYGILVADLVVSALIYLRTKNLQNFILGTPILMAFSAMMYKLIGA